MELVACRYKLISTLEDIKNWRRDIYKGYDNNIKIFCNGKIYTRDEFEKSKDELPKDENGLIKNCEYVYLDNDLIEKIDELLYDIDYLLN